jgi:hypothetical protein
VGVSALRHHRQGTLDLHRGSVRLGGVEEHHEERIALRIDFPALMRGKYGP